jgi:putative zinc finger/helix-turn-helix YgiT family protein
MKPYNYSECGIRNVLIHGISPVIDDEGDEVISIKNIKDLHRAIAQAVVAKKGGMTAEELRFLRTEMGETQEAFAKIIGYERLQITRWEKGEIKIPQAIDMLIRALAVQKILKDEINLEATSQKITEKADENLNIEATDDFYRPAMFG